MRRIILASLILVTGLLGIPRVSHSGNALASTHSLQKPARKVCKTVTKKVHSKKKKLKVCHTVKARPTPTPTDTPTDTSTPNPTDTPTATATTTMPPFTGKVDIGGYALYLHCAGNGSPTVLIQYGYHGSIADWTAEQNALAPLTRVCVYDLAGNGQSDPGPVNPTSSTQTVKEMHALIAAAHLAAPLVLAGSSLGGLNARLYTYTYPNDVAGLVLVDAVHEDLYSFIPGSDLDLPASFAQVDAFTHGTAKGTLGSLPLAVLSHGIPLAYGEAQWQAGQNDLAMASTNSVHVIVTNAGHRIDVDNPPIVEEAVREVVTAARASTHQLPPCGAAFTGLSGKCVP